MKLYNEQLSNWKISTDVSSVSNSKPTWSQKKQREHGQLIALASQRGKIKGSMKAVVVEFAAQR